MVSSTETEKNCAQQIKGYAVLGRGSCNETNLPLYSHAINFEMTPLVRLFNSLSLSVSPLMLVCLTIIATSHREIPSRPIYFKNESFSEEQKSN